MGQEESAAPESSGRALLDVLAEQTGLERSAWVPGVE